MIYKDKYYAKARLHGTVIRVNGVVVYLQYVDDWTYSCTDLAKSTSKNIDLSKAEVDLTPLPLGFVNKRGCSYYLSRSPVRRWKQGLSNESLKTTEVPLDEEVRARVGLGLLTSREIVACISNKYPTLLEAYKKVSEGRCSAMAFHRRFAITRNKGDMCDLWYKTKPVGTISRNGVRLISKYSYLKEMIEEILK